MSAINIITAMRSSILAMTGKTTASKTVAAQPEAAVNVGSATISSDATSRNRHEQKMAEISAGRAQARINNVSGSNLTSPEAAQFAHDYAHSNFTDGMGTETGGSGMVNVAVAFDIRGTLVGGDGILRYSSGEPVTKESQTYWKQQIQNFQNDLLRLYDTEAAKETPPGEILNKFLDLEEQQPARFRAMMMWPNSTDFASNQPGTTSAGLKA